MVVRNILTLLIFASGLIPFSVSAEIFQLNKLVPVGNVKLHSIKDKYKISIPIPNRWQVKGAVLKFSYINSSALLAYKSRLVVSLDNIPLFQASLDPSNYEKRAEVKLPGRMLKPGYHELVFEVAQHSEQECEDPFAPELWTVLKLGEATLNIDFSNRAIPLKLSSISEYVEDPKIFPFQKINIVLESMDKELLDIATTVAGGIGARLSYRPVHLSVSSSFRPGIDNVYIGTNTGLAQRGVSRETKLPGPTVAIGHIPISPQLGNNVTDKDLTKEDIHHAMITITGNNMDEVKKAAQAFSSISFPFPQSPSMHVENVEFPSIKPYHKKALLSPGLPTRFIDLGFKTHVFVGMHKEPVTLEFFLPPDLYIKPNQYATLSLHFGFSAAVRKDSTMKIELNGKPVSSIHLDKEHGAFYENYKILVPTYLFRPGKNRITFETVLVPLIIKRCQGFQDMNLFLTLFEDSMIAFPDMGHWGKMPQIRYFFDSGFPFTKYTIENNTVFLLMEPDIHSVTLAMNIAAYLGQLNGIAPTNLEFTFDPEQVSEKEVILIGPVNKIPASFTEKAPLKLKESSAHILYPQFVDLSQESQRTFWKKLEEKLENYSKLFPVKGIGVNSRVSAKKVALDDQTGLLMEFESPVSQGRTVLMWTGKDSSIFADTARLLWSGRLRSMAHGDLVLYTTKSDEKVYSLKVGHDYYVGRLDKTEKIDFLLRSYPWLFYSILGICFIVLAIIFATYLRWRRKKRLANEI